MDERKLRLQNLGMLILLVLQFILGMALNLFVTLPDKHPGQNGNYFVRSGHSYGWAITADGGIALFLHVLVATGLLAGGIAFAVRAVMSHKKQWILVSILGLVGILAAFSNGLSFLDFNEDFSSFIMAMGFIVAASAYVVGFALQSPSNPKAKK